MWGRDHAGMMMIVVVDVVVAAAAIVHHHRASTKEMMASRGVTRIIESSCMSSLCRSIRDDCFGYLLYLAGFVIRNLPIDWLTTNKCGEKDLMSPLAWRFQTYFNCATDNLELLPKAPVKHA